MENTQTEFKGFEAVINKGTDRPRPVRVINEGVGIETGCPTYKVIHGMVAGYTGDHYLRAEIVYNGRPMWVLKSKDTRGRF